MLNIILWTFICFSSTFSYAYLYYKLVDNPNKINLKIILIFMIGSISSTLLEIFNLNIITTFLFFLFFPLLFYSIKNVGFKKLIFYLLIIWLYAILIDLLLIFILSIISYILKFNLYSNYNNLISMILTLLVSVILIFASYSKKMKTLTEALYKKVFNIKYFTIVLVILTSAILVITILMLFNIMKLDVNILSLIMVYLIVLLFIIFIKKKNDEQELLKCLQTLKENNEFYIQVEDENRIFKHNLVAKLLSIKSVSNKKSKALIDDLIYQYNKTIYN